MIALLCGDDGDDNSDDGDDNFILLYDDGDAGDGRSSSDGSGDSNDVGGDDNDDTCSFTTSHSSP